MTKLSSTIRRLRKALYWDNSNRGWRPGRQEMAPDDVTPKGKPGPYFCPKCKTHLRRKRPSGNSVYACPDCLFMVPESAILLWLNGGPDALED